MAFRGLADWQYLATPPLRPHQQCHVRLNYELLLLCHPVTVKRHKEI